MQITQFDHFPAELKNDWNQLLVRGLSHVPFLRFEYLSDWWQTRGGGEWPSDAELIILVAREADELIGIAPFFITDHEGEKRLLLVGSIEISDFLDLIVPADKVKLFAAAILDYFVENLVPLGVNTLDLYNLLEDSPTLPALAEAAQASGFSITQNSLQQAPFIKLPGDWEVYLESLDKKQRHEIRRKMRRAAEAEIPAEMVILSDPDLLDTNIEAFLSLMAQDPEKESFLTPAMREQFRINARQTHECGCLQLSFLRIGGENAAAYLSFDYQNRIWVYNSGLDRRFMEYSPGWVLLGYLLKWANENKREEFDFMRGNEDYKYKFGAVDRFVVRLTLSISK